VEKLDSHVFRILDEEGIKEFKPCHWISSRNKRIENSTIRLKLLMKRNLTHILLMG